MRRSSDSRSPSTSTAPAIIYSLDHNEHAGTVHILTILGWLQRHRGPARGDRAGGLRMGDLLDRQAAGDVHGQRLHAAVKVNTCRLPEPPPHHIPAPREAAGR